jgi:phosphatidylglycerol lysyltransferase
VSFFAPIRFRLRHSQRDYNDAKAILEKNSRTSEDFFKVQPFDKTYFFSTDRKAMIAYKVVAGVALVVGDPVGPKSSIRQLVTSFLGYCRINDWTPAFIHTDGGYLKLYEALGLNIQKIGEEAIVNVEYFNKQVSVNKYFRHIKNKFDKQGYTCQILNPPHSSEVIERLGMISSDWLNIPGKSERGFMMGYFSKSYMQSCRLMVVCDRAGQIQAFLNQIRSFRPDEASYDLLRSASTAPTNANDYLMLNFINYLTEQGCERLNMGLSPLSGLGPDDAQNRSVIDGLLHFVYDNADRFYSFQGLARFKSKYEPDWEGRYIIYQGNLPAFAKTMNTLLKAMRLK